MVIDRKLKLAANIAAEVVMRDVKGVKAVLVCTEDGFELATRVENTGQVARMSAMASSLAALGALAGEESNLGMCDSLVMEASDGFMAILQIRRSDTSLVMSVVTGREAVVGQLLYFSKLAARTLGKA